MHDNGFVFQGVYNNFVCPAAGSNMGSHRLGGSAYRNISNVPAERYSTVADTGAPSDDSPQMS